jgi:hypothetical protein
MIASSSRALLTRAVPVVISGRHILGKTIFFRMLPFSIKIVRHRVTTSENSDQQSIPAVRYIAYQ